ncbi:hypothetical protein HS1genome_0739 [Sulfodiicoccus acidiphilus]|uniref:DNA methylase N-4/N-6 domain-containing protein n=1 Tax=Sulfodiicoccus acidiphilus TaxID=1670455 RepID=A0A348B2E8_9CREN|nr:site-specific DNA-methyltransferase [Sulfodiicoccus acidiphilus]BBD72350.1 hypothetical protein HS1genome_0739 [Sulfodiicoccus acidiphilus]GGT90100.1 hypothetical protein GCM10007116_04830 [Sulfodiicoccus acidiphilus]
MDALASLRRRYGKHVELPSRTHSILQKLFDEEGNPVPPFRKTVELTDVKLVWSTQDMIYVGLDPSPEGSHLLIPKEPEKFFKAKMAEIGVDDEELLATLTRLEEGLLKKVLNPSLSQENHVVSSLELPSDLLQAVLSHPNFEAQVNEWRELGLNPDSPRSSHLPVDTAFFPELRGDIKKSVELKGTLIRGDSLLALRALIPQNKGKVKAIYIDPPFNKDRERDFTYSVNYPNHMWLTMLENRLEIAKDILRDDGAIFVRCDHDGNMLVRLLMNTVFGEENFRNEIDIKRNQSLPKTSLKKLTEETENLLVYSKGEGFKFKRMFVPREAAWVDLGTRPADSRGKPIRIDGKEFYPPKGRRWAYSEAKVRELYNKGLVREVKGKLKILLDKRAVGTNWTDIPGYSTNPKWGLKTENSEILLKRVIESSTEPGDTVMDFFLGSGTTTAVAHKMGRSWIGVELGVHFSTVIMRRMKLVIAGDSSGVSKEAKWRGGGGFTYFKVALNDRRV